MKLSTLRVICGWIFIAGHYSNFILLFFWGLFWSESGFSGVSDIFTLMLPISGVAAVASVKAFWRTDLPTKRRVKVNTAVMTIMLPSILTVLIWCLLIAYVMQLADGPKTVKIGIGMCELAFGGVIALFIEKLFVPDAKTDKE